MERSANGNKTEWSANGLTVLIPCNANKTGTIFDTYHVWPQATAAVYTNTVRTCVDLNRLSHSQENIYTNLPFLSPGED